MLSNVYGKNGANQAKESLCKAETSKLYVIG